MLQQLFLQRPAGLDEQRAVNGLVRHLAGLILRIRALEPTSYLIGRPLEPQLFGHRVCQRLVLCQFTALRPLRQISRLTVLGARRSARAIARTDSLAITPREITSRSVKARAILFSDSPSRHRSHISALSVSV
jgi:hypothetical protein